MDVGLLFLIVLGLSVACVGGAVWLGLRLRAIEAATKVENEGNVPANPGGCTKTSHVWRKRPHLISGYEEIFYCAKGCGSTLRHRVK